MGVNFGIVGAGNIANKFAKAVAICDDANICAVAARDLERAEKFANAYGIDKAYGDYESLFNDEKVDIVYVAVVHNYHFDLVKQAILHGKAVICEKPMVISLSDCQELVDLAREKNVLLMEGLWSRFLPAYKKAKEWIAEGKIGTPVNFSAEFSWKAQFNPNGRLFNPDLAGGALFDVGCYAISAALDICGGSMPSAVHGVAQIGETGVDEQCSAVMKFENGMMANVSFGFRVSLPPIAYVTGTEGKIYMEEFWHCGVIELRKIGGEVIERFESPFDNGFEYQIQEMCDLFKAHKTESSIMSLDHSLNSMRVMDRLLIEYFGEEDEISENLSLDM